MRYQVVNSVSSNPKAKLAGFLMYNYILLLVPFLLGCQEQEKSEYFGLVLKGKLQNASKTALFFEELTPSDLIPVDSIYTDTQGNFEFELFIEDAGFYRLGVSSDNYITLAVEPNETIRILADASNLNETYQVKGSPGSAILWHLNASKIKANQDVDSLRNLYKKYNGSANFTSKRDNIRKAYGEIREQQVDFIKDLIRKNPNNLASILALYHPFDDKLLLKDSDNVEFSRLLSKSLCESYPTNKHVMDLKKRVNEHKRTEEQRRINERNLAIGMTAPEISLPSHNGHMMSLSSLRGKVVLIDFWAAWCPPCRKANVELSEIYNQFNHKGFEIFGVSLDRTRDQWLKAIENDNITWIQVSDLRFMNSPVVSLYNVQNIPNNILINKQGEIIAKNISPEQLSARLKEML
jgi:peroxiredoxin